MNATIKLLWFVCVLLVSAAATAHGIAPYPDAVPRTRSAGAALLELALLSAHAGSVSITVEGDFRVIRADGLPDHATGQFPGRGNPNRISAQRYDYRVPLNPHPAGRVTALRMQSFGIAINGVPFDPGAAEFWNNDRNWQYEAMSGAVQLGLDENNAHVQPNGAYHYHGLPTGLVARLNRQQVALVGWAADGYPIYVYKQRASYRLKPGTRQGGPGGSYDGAFVQDYEYAAGLGDLDECNGRSGVTPELPGGGYHYVLTEHFPFIPRCYKGTPDASFERRGPPGGGGGGPGGAGGGGGAGKASPPGGAGKAPPPFGGSLGGPLGGPSGGPFGGPPRF